MSDKYFLDTNIIVYSFDNNNPVKQGIAKKLISNALNHKGCISYQVAQEFLNVATGKFKTQLSIPESKVFINAVLAPLCEVFPSIEFYNSALQIKERWQYSFYDSLIITAALQAECTTLYSEDMQHDQAIGNLNIINPFKK